MKKQLQKKHKIMIGAGAGLLGAAAVATPLTIVLTQQDKHINQLNFDKKYGLDKAQYNKMKTNLLNAYSAELDAESIADKEARMAKLTRQFNSLDNAIKQSNKSINTYFTATSSLLALNKEINKGLEKGVVLTRESRANWNEVQEMFNGMVKSFKTYMTNHFFDRDVIDEVIKKATESYDEMINNLKESYSNDILGGVLKAKTQLISCFVSINTVIAKLAGTMRLNEFMGNYTFTFKNASDGEANRLNKLVSSQKLVVDSVISTDTMNTMFDCYNKETRQSAQFSEDMIPGYKLAPVFKGVEANAEKNEYSAKIDWTIVSNYYANTNDKEAATAHLVDANEDYAEKMQQLDNCKDINDILDLMKDNVKIVNYSMLNTSKDGVDSEHNQLKNTYFNAAANNGASIKLYFKDKDAWYDGFMFADQTKFGEPQTITMQQLSYTGIRITDGTNDYSLKELINIVNQDNYEPKNLAEKFVKYCDLNDTITLTNDQTNGVVIVTSQFNAWYRNEEQWQQHGQSNSSAYTLPDTLEAKNLPLSTNFFGTVNQNFNKAYRDSHIFIDQKYGQYDRTTDTLAGLALFTSLYADGLAASAVVYTIAAIIKNAVPQIFLGLGVTALAGLFCYGSNISWKNLMDNWSIPMGEYSERAKEFEAGEYFDIVKDTLAADEGNFALWDEECNIDPEEYNEKLQAFRKTIEEKGEEGMQWAKELFDKYNNFEMEGGIGYKFFKEAERLEIDPVQYAKDFGDWKPIAGWFSVSVASNILCGLSVGGILGLFGKMPPVEGITAEQYALKAAADNGNSTLAYTRALEEAHYLEQFGPLVYRGFVL